MSWSIGTIFKLNIVVWIFFFILKRPFSRFLKNIIFCITPQIPNIIIFLMWPKMLFDFIPSNIAFSLNNAVAFYRVSGTFPRELANLLGIPITAFSIVTMVILIPLVLFILNKRQMHLVDQIFLVILATIEILPDFWMTHALYVIIPYMLWLSARSPTLSLKLKLICFVPICCVTPWMLLYHAMLSINLATDPHNTITIPGISVFFIIPLVIMIVNGIRLKTIKSEIAHNHS
ncbi:MAG: hypothetical protein Q6373_012370 [Candidatus Sigynarchaeota archaeon]